MIAELLFYPENCVLCHLCDSEFDDGLGWNPDLLLRLGVEARPRFSFLFHQLPKAWQDEFAVLFDFFLSQRAECIEKRSRRLLVCLSGLGECNLKFCFGHLLERYVSGIERFQGKTRGAAGRMGSIFSVGSPVSARLSKRGVVYG